MRLFMISSKFTSLKKGCRLISSASSFEDPSRRAGSRVKSCRTLGLINQCYMAPIGLLTF